MHKHKIEDKLLKILKKIELKDKNKFEIIIKKINEIINCKSVNHYKNLKKPIQKYKRVHIDSNFVLLFKYENEIIYFCKLNHHDDIYTQTQKSL